MSPDEQFEAQRQKEEKTKLDAMVSSLTPEQKKEVFDKGVELLKQQMAEPDVSCLPTLTVNDIKKEASRISTTTHHASKSACSLFLFLYCCVAFRIFLPEQRKFQFS